MTAWTVLLWCVNWISAHPVETMAAVGFVCSLSEKWLLAKWPTLGRVAGAFSAMGVDWPKLWGKLSTKEPAVVAAIQTAVEKKAEGK